MRKTRMFLILGLALAAVAALAAEISIDADRTVDFSAFKTYAWKANDKASDPLVDQAIVADIEEQLAAKGLKKVEGPPDLFVQYHVILQKEAKLTDWDEGKFKFENRNITVQRLTVGTLPGTSWTPSRARWSGRPPARTTSPPRRSLRNLPRG